ncbi:MAG: AI-2E family transporter [Weeksellaceae bacterium]
MQKYIPNSILRQVVFLIILAILVWVVLKGLSTFLPGFLGAICLFVLLIKPMYWMMEKWKMSKILAVILLMTGSILIILTPLVYLINVLTSRVTDAIHHKAEIQAQIELGLKKVHEEFGIDLLNQINLSDITSLSIKIIQEILNTSMDSIIQIAVAYLLVYFMLMNYKKIEKWLYRHIPLKNENLQMLNKDLRDLVLSNAIGVPLVALLQAIVALIGYLIFGLTDPFNWFILTAFAAMLPVVGSAVIYIPAVIYMIAAGNTPNAYFLLIYCFVIVGASDNIFRFWLQKVMVDVHPLITIFGVILGVKLFGFIGIIFGPIFLSLIFWLFRIYNLEFSNSKKKPTTLTKEDS